jgi:hypothetical protein
MKPRDTLACSQVPAPKSNSFPLNQFFVDITFNIILPLILFFCLKYPLLLKFIQLEVCVRLFVLVVRAARPTNFIFLLPS